jgi:hypothetical protein
MASQALAQRVWQRARARCEYCQMPQEFDPLPFQIDHIIARKHRGRTRMENLALACFACNNHQGPNIAGIDPDTHAVTPLFHPLNLPRRVALCRALMEEGVFAAPEPPSNINSL